MSKNLHPQLYGGAALGNCPEMREVFETVDRWKATVSDFLRTTILLKEDAVRTINAFNSKPNDQFRRRQVIRNLFALFEGQIFLMKRICLERYEHLEFKISGAELAMLREEKYVLEKDGEAHISTNNYQKFVPNYQFTMKSFAKAHGGTWTPEKERVIELGSLERVRNRLTHPKCFEDLHVSDAEMKISNKVLNWHIAQSALTLSIMRNGETLSVRNLVSGAGYPFRATLPVFLIWRNGDVYEFPTKEKAKRFANAKGGRKGALDFTVTSVRDAREGDS